MTCSELFALVGFEVPVRLRGSTMAPQIKAPDSVWPTIEDASQLDDLSILFSRASSRLAKNPLLNPHQVILDEAQVKVAAHGVESLSQRPKSSGLLVLGTHPNGGFDGLSVAASLAAIDDKPAMIVAKGVVGEIPTMKPLVIAVDTSGTVAAAKANLKIRDQIKNALTDGHTVVIFPSGSIAGAQNGKVQEMPWKKLAIEAASAAKASVATAWVEPIFGPSFNSSQLRKDVSQAIYTNQIRNKTVNVVFSPPRHVEENISKKSAQDLTDELQRMTVQMGEDFMRQPR